MRIKSLSFLIGLLLSASSSSIACVSQTLTTQETSATPAQRPARVVGDSTASARWKRYNLDDVPSLNLILPSEPERQTASSGTAETTRVYMSRDSSGVYGAAYLDDLPAAASRSEESGKDFLFNTFIKAFAVSFQNLVQVKGNDLQVKMLEQRQVRVSGVEGIEQDFTLDSFNGRARIIRVGDVGVSMVAIWTQNARLSDRIAFFDSARVEKGEGSNLKQQ